MTIKVGVVVYTSKAGDNTQEWFLSYELANNYADVLMENRNIDGAVVSEFSLPFQIRKEELPEFIQWMNKHASNWYEKKTK